MIRVVLTLLLPFSLHAKEIALSFDDAPTKSTKHFTSEKRSEELIRKLERLNIPPVMIFANPCKSTTAIGQLRKYRIAGHFIGNHTCSHPRLDDVGFEEYTRDAYQAHKMLSALFDGPKFFRYPFLNEGQKAPLRDRVREWLRDNGYRNGAVSVDNDDYLFSFKINQAIEANKPVDYVKVETLFVQHVLGAANFYDQLAVKTLGRSPKHVLLLHEVDATVMFLDALVKALREDGWKIISVKEAYRDKIYFERPQNTYANNGLIAQLNFEKTGERVGYAHFETIRTQLNKILGLAEEH